MMINVRKRFALAAAGAVVTLLTSGAVPMAAAGASPANAPAPPQSQGLWIAGTSSDKFSERVESAVQSDPKRVGAAKRLVSSLLEKSNGGVNQELPGSPGSVTQDRAELQETMKTLRAPTSSPSPQAVPPEFKLRGQAINDDFSWQLNTILEGAFCMVECEVTDRVNVRWTMDPGRAGDRFSFNAVYSPNAGNFSNVFGAGYSFCNNNWCAREEIPPPGLPRDGSGSGSQAVEHPSVPGGTIVNALGMNGTFGPNGQTIQDLVKTGVATCRTGSDRSCTY